MAIKPMPKQIREFLPRFNKRIVTMVVLMNLLIVLIVAAILIYTHVFNISSIELWSIIAGLAFISIVSSLFSISTASGPTKDLLTAITHISGEPTDKPFPSPTDKKYAGTGFQSALQTLYELSGTHTQLDTSVAPVKTVESVMDTALEQTTSGFVVLNHERKIIYSNKSAPVHTSPTGDKTLQLFFNGSDTLDAWLNTCEEESVHAEHVWTRIAVIFSTLSLRITRGQLAKPLSPLLIVRISITSTSKNSTSSPLLHMNFVALLPLFAAT
jgi:hypothetical protein